MSFLNRFKESPEPRMDELRSVVENLTHLLNSKEGFASVVRDFGLGEYQAQRGGADTIRVLMREIKEDVARYEPRLTLQSLRSLGRDSDMWLHLELCGRVGGRAHRFHIRFGATLGCVQVEVLDAE